MKLHGVKRAAQLEAAELPVFSARSLERHVAFPDEVKDSAHAAGGSKMRSLHFLCCACNVGLSLLPRTESSSQGHCIPNDSGNTRCYLLDLL